MNLQVIDVVAALGSTMLAEAPSLFRSLAARSGDGRAFACVGSEDPRARKKPASTCETLQLPAPALRWETPCTPITVALPRMLAQIETELATAGPVETRRLRERAELIRELLTPWGRSPIP
jgi:hypothetical protein